jgi:hypothetical protein
MIDTPAIASQAPYSAMDEILSSMAVHGIGAYWIASNGQIRPIPVTELYRKREDVSK